MASTPETEQATATIELLGRSDHPDEELIENAREALGWWATQRPAYPSSSITGGGAVSAVEQAMVRLLGGDVHVLALPNATFGLRLALRCGGIQPGDDVLTSAVDWSAARAAITDVGARPIAVPVLSDTLTMDPDAAARLRTSRTTAVIATHLHGLPVDVPRLRALLSGGIVIIEDAAQALGSRLGEVPAGTLGDLAVFSLGPGKIASAGELGFLVTTRNDSYVSAVCDSQHPIRQLLTGVARPRTEAVIGRPSVLSAIVGAYQLANWGEASRAYRLAELPLRRALRKLGIASLGGSDQQPPPGRFPVLVADGGDDHLLRALRESSGAADGRAPHLLTSGCTVDHGLDPATFDVLNELVSRTRIIDCWTSTSTWRLPTVHSTSTSKSATSFASERSADRRSW